jgi:hypothetical protein
VERRTGKAHDGKNNNKGAWISAHIRHLSLSLHGRQRRGDRRLA